MEAVAKKYMARYSGQYCTQVEGETLLFELRGGLNEIHCKYIF